MDLGMNIRLEQFRELFTDKGNTVNQFWLFNKEGNYICSICSDDITKYDPYIISEAYMNIDADTECPVLCLHLDV